MIYADGAVFVGLVREGLVRVDASVFQVGVLLRGVVETPMDAVPFSSSAEGLSAFLALDARTLEEVVADGLVQLVGDLVQSFSGGHDLFLDGAAFALIS